MMFPGFRTSHVLQRLALAGRSVRSAGLRLGCAALFLLGVAAHAASYTNEPTSDVILNWMDDARWQGTGVPNGVGDDATFVGFSGTLNVPKAWDLGGNSITLGSIHYLQAGSQRAGAIQIRMTNGTVVLQAPSGTALIHRAPFRGYEHNLDVTYNDMVFANLVLNSDLRIETGEDTLNHANLPYGYTIQGKISGPGTLSKTGPGTVILYGQDNDFSGNIYVQQGTLYTSNSLPLGQGSKIVLGSRGHTGQLTVMGNGATTLTRDIELVAGGAGRLTGLSKIQSSMTYNTKITGEGRLIVDKHRPVILQNGAGNTYSGGTWIQGADVRATPNGNVFGTGDVNIHWDGSLQLANANNLDADASVRLVSAKYGHIALHRLPVLMVQSDFMPTLTSDSTGHVAWKGNSGANINAVLAEGAPQLGSGFIYYGASRAHSTFTGTSLQPNKDDVYRFVSHQNAIYGTTVYNFTLDATNTTTGVLTGDRSVEVIGQAWASPALVYLKDANDFTGPLTITHSSLLDGQVQANGSPFGSEEGAVNLVSGRLRLTGTGGGQDVAKGALTISGNASLVNTGTDGGSLTLTFNNLTRTDRALLTVNYMTGVDTGAALGGSAKIKLLNGAPTPVNGMVAPWMNNLNEFLTYDADGFKVSPFSKTNIAGAGATDRVNVTTEGDGAVNGGGQTIYALRTTQALTGGTLTITSGGLLLGAAGVDPRAPLSHSAPLNFGNAEGVIMLDDAAYHKFTGAITANNGLTVGGRDLLTSATMCLELAADNSATLKGQITINRGLLYHTADNQLGAATNVVYLNSGSNEHSFQGGDGGLILGYSPSSSRKIVLGPNGGTIFPINSAVMNYEVSGEGSLTFAGLSYPISTSGSVTISKALTHLGGTYFTRFGGSVTVNADAKLGAGPVYLGNTQGDHQATYLKGTDNIDDMAPLILISNSGNFGHINSRVEFQGASETIGSLEGNGLVVLGTENVSHRLTFGANDLSTEFFGDIIELNPGRGALEKVGTGTFTLWGEGRYTGGTTVQNGTFLVHGSLDENSTVVVSGPEARLGGSGVVGTVVIEGGTLLGDGLQTAGVHFKDHATLRMNIQGPQKGVGYTPLSIGGDLQLEAGTKLQLELDYAPDVGQKILVVENPGAQIFGTFSEGLVAAQHGGRTYYFKVAYDGGDGDDIELTVVPSGTLIYAE